MNKKVFFKEFNLVNELIKRDLKKKYRGSILGVLWTVLNPLLMMVVLTIVFSNIFRFDIVNFPLYLITGQVIFTFFSEATNMAMISIIGNASLIKKIYIRKSLFPLSSVTFSLVNSLFSIIAILLIVLVTKSKISFSFFLIPVILGYVYIFAYGIGLILATLVVYFRDIIHLYGVFLMITMYLTPIFYPENIIPDQYKMLVLINPMIYFVRYFRKIIYDGTFPDMNLNLICLSISIGTVIIGNFVFKKFENIFVLKI